VSYRDDHDAIHERVEELERDLGRARQELDQNRAERAKVQRLEKELAKARAKIERLQPKDQEGVTRDARRRALLVAISAALVVAGGAAAFILAAGDRAEPDTRATARRTEAERAKAVEAARAREAEELKKVQLEITRVKELEARARAAAEASARGKARARTATARWRASVKVIRGRPLTPGTPCTLVARLSIEEGKASAAELAIRCGAVVLYNPDDELGSGTELFESGAEPIGDGRRYRLKYADQGARTGPRAQVSVNTAERVAEVWSDNAPRFRAVLRVDEGCAPVVLDTEAAEQ